MIKSPYATQYTRQQIAGEKNPQRDMTNRVAQERSLRIQKALSKEAQKGK